MNNLSVIGKSPSGSVPQQEFLKKYGQLKNPELANEVMDELLKGDLSLFGRNQNV